ncbi:MAG TPA: hypothetical protein VF065_11925, partial [Ilumatobacter sp.]
MTRPHVAAAILVALGIAASGCGRNADAGEIAVLRVVTGNSDDSHGEYHFEVPTNVPAGATRLELVNDGAEPHHAQLFEFADGATISDLTRALGTGDPAAALEFGSFLGGTALVSPGTRSQADAVVELEPRRYALICLVPDPDGTPHLAHGMLRPFDVVEHDDPASPPDADLDVRLIDYAFEMPETIDGDATLAITNASRDEPHEMVFLRADDDTAPAAVAAAVHA